MIYRQNGASGHLLTVSRSGIVTVATMLGILATFVLACTSDFPTGQASLTLSVPGDSVLAGGPISLDPKA